MVSIIETTTDAFNNPALPKFYRDPLLNGGTVFRFDFLNPYCINNQAAGNISNGGVFKNLVDGGPNLIFALASGQMAIKTGNLGITSPGQISGPSSLGVAAGQGDMHTPIGDHSFVRHLWFKLAATGYPASVQQLFGDRDTTSSPYWGANPGQGDLYTGSAGDTNNAIRRNNGTAIGTSLTAGGAANLAHLASVAFDVATANLTLYFDGVAVGSVSDANFGTLGTPAMRSHNLATFTGPGTNGDPFVVNGTTITLVASGASGNQVNIGADATATAQAVKTFINARSSTLLATAEGSGAALRILQAIPADGSAVPTIALSTTSSAITLGTAEPSRSLRLNATLKGEAYLLALEDLTISGRSAAAAVTAEYNGYRPKLVAAGLAT